MYHLADHIFYGETRKFIPELSPDISPQQVLCICALLAWSHLKCFIFLLQVQRGINTQTEALEVTCIDANKDFIALGSNIGIVFLYDRSKRTIERLRSDVSIL